MAEGNYKRYEGLRWRMCYGRYDGVERCAVTELQREVQSWLPYVIETTPESGAGAHEGHEILLGTAADNARIQRLIREKWIAVPPSPESYAIRVGDNPWSKGTRIIAIAGSDERGVLYGVQDFNSQVIGLGLFTEPPTVQLRRQDFDKMPDVSIAEQPAIQNRGIWTWGYVIYDYKRYIDNMARLRMNMLIMWNDCPPVNIEDIIEYAHCRGVRIVMGFHWGWGLNDLVIGKPEDRRAIRDMVLRNYEKNYAHLAIDGIYFQTLTETAEQLSAGMTIAAAARELVNDTAAALFAKHPHLLIYFGLHATSIANNLDDLKALDRRVPIMWEDAGAMPWSYYPANEIEGGAWKKVWENELAAGRSPSDLTVEYAKKLASLRPDAEFAMVPKGWFSLRWGSEFENHGPFVLGERDPQFIRRRADERAPRWDAINAQWLRRYGTVARFYRELLDCGPRGMTVAGLIEDGMFEAGIEPSAALFGQTIWNPRRSDEQILWAAGSPYYRKFQI